MGDGVMMKLSGGKEVHPFLRVVGTEDAEIGFNLYWSVRFVHLSEGDMQWRV